MGTNYYAYTNEFGTVECNCGFSHRMREKLHIGKNSYGWYFILQVIPEKGLFELDDWKPLLKKARIVDEYGSEVFYDEMIEIIRKKNGRGKEPTEEEKKRIMDGATNGVILDTRCWLYHMGGQLGKDGNYCLEEREFC